MSQKRSYYRYELRDNHQLVYIGITDNPSRREVEHKSEGKKFTNIKIVSPAITKDSAIKWERERLEKYRRNHGGENPRYNET